MATQYINYEDNIDAFEDAYLNLEDGLDIVKELAGIIQSGFANSSVDGRKIARVNELLVMLSDRIEDVCSINFNVATR